MITRLGLYGGSRGLYGDFSGKEELVTGGRTNMVFRFDWIWDLYV